MHLVHSHHDAPPRRDVEPRPTVRCGDDCHQFVHNALDEGGHVAAGLVKHFKRLKVWLVPLTLALGGLT